MGFVVFGCFILFIVLLVLDILKKINLTHFWVIFVYLVFLPHMVLGGYFLFATVKSSVVWSVVLLIEVFLMSAYIWVKFNIMPIKLKEDVAKRLKIMMGGRALTYFGLYALTVQAVVCFLGYHSLAPYRIPVNILVFDGVVTFLTCFILLGNGMLRILFTSRRLSIVRRIIFIFAVWVTVFNVLVIFYICHIVRLEYDHECYKVVNHKARVDSQICATKYPLVMVHGIGFRDLKYINYWGRIPKELIRNGATMYYGNQEACGTIEYNASDMKSRILEIINETGCEKVNIIAHSKGGLDARYLISSLGMSDYVASLTTMASPHHGSMVIDSVLKLPKFLLKGYASLVNKFHRSTGDKNPDFYKALCQFSTAFSKQFNEGNPDMQGVYYQSYTSVMKGFFSDSLLCIPYFIVKLKEKENDGLVSPESAKWGEFKGVIRNKYRRGISHGDIIDLKREDYKGFDIIEKYVEMVTELRQKGF